MTRILKLKIELRTSETRHGLFISEENRLRREQPIVQLRTRITKSRPRVRSILTDISSSKQFVIKSELTPLGRKEKHYKKCKDNNI